MRKIMTMCKYGLNRKSYAGWARKTSTFRINLGKNGIKSIHF